MILSAHSMTGSPLRPFDVRRDLSAVVDLVELCFNETLDPDGQSFLQRMRSASRQPALLHWAAATADWASAPFSGYVWEENGRIVGNVNLIPYYQAGRRFFLIANVAVHPDFRRRGIARHLTKAALQHVRQRNVPSVWLQVREDNPAAVQLYRSLSFVERARRTTWFSSPALPAQEPQDGLQFHLPCPEHWPLQRQWLAQAYPPELTWHLSLKAILLRPGLWGDFLRFLYDASVRQWAVSQDGQLQAVASWQMMSGHANALWLASRPEIDWTVLQALILHARQQLPPERTLFIEHPARQANDAIRRAGFYAHQTLIWMQYIF